MTQFSKTVAIKATDDDEMTATGVVLTPNELDRQLDWLDEDGVRNFHTDDPDDGVMHAAFPTGHALLERNEVLDEPETIDGVEFDAGEWVIRRRYQDQQRWSLVKSGALSAFSIGGDIEEAQPFESLSDLPDEVDIPAEVDPDAVPPEHWPPTKLVSGAVNEISDVDVGAVPSADMAVVKSLGKSPLEQVNSEDEFVAMMNQRGTMGEKKARETWQYIQEAEKTEKQSLDADVQDCKDSVLEDNPGMTESDAIAICRAELGKKSNEPAESGADCAGKDAMSNDTDTDTDEQTDGASKFDDVESVDDATLGKRIKSLLFGSNEADDDSASEDSGANKAETPDKDAQAAEKVGRTLSKRNVEYAKEIHDDAEEMLREAGIDCHSPATRTYHEDKSDPFERKDDYDKAAASGENSSETTPAESGEDADTTDKMTDEDTDTEKSEAPGWAESLSEKVESLNKRVAEIEGGDGANEAEKSLDDAPEWAQELAEKVDDVDERVDKVAKAEADTDQIGGENSAETTDETSAFKTALGGN